MAIVVKGKIRLCQTSLADWNPERVNGVLFYDRYQEFHRLFSAKIPQVDFEKCFAQPVYNDETNAIEWFSVPMDEYPNSLSEVSDARAEAEMNRIITAIKNAAKSLSENDLKYLNPILKTLQSDKIDTVTYHYNGQVVFGVWGMSMKKGKTITDVIIDDIKDHRTHHIKYEVRGKGKVSFSDIVRRHGHTLGGETDIPSITPAPGYLVKEWQPESPSGVKVDKPLHFTLVFERDPNYIPPENETPEENEELNPGIAAQAPEEIPQAQPQEPNFYNVKFSTDGRGKIHGQSEYRKQEGARVLHAEVPHVEPQEGYRFLGWTIDPINYLVNGDTEFVAQYEPIESKTRNRFWWLSGCLNWLLALLLLLLIALLLWYLLGHHNVNCCGNCDCGCDEEVVYDNDPNVVVQNCDEPQAKQGGIEGYRGRFNMGQKSGTFIFKFNTYTKPDAVRVHDGQNITDRVIYNYGPGGTNEWKSVSLRFTNTWIFVEVDGDPTGTGWDFIVDCPN